MVNRLLNVETWKKWDIQIEAQAQVIESRRLAMPELEPKNDQDKPVYITEPILKKLPVSKDKLKGTNLILLYTESRNVNRDVVENTFNNLMNCQRQMGMNSKEIMKRQVPDLRDT